MSDTKLNNDQLKAARHLDGPLLVLAGPGSGKTRILQERAAWLVNDLNIIPQEISIVTFTRKAAGEIRRRIAENMEPEKDEQIKLSTLHSNALRIITAEKRLKKEGIPEVIGELVAFEYLQRAMTEAQMDVSMYPPASVWNQISVWKNGERDKESLPQITQILIDKYQAILNAERKWDIQDLIVNAIDVLERNSAIREASQSSYMMVDEWQDTSLSEYKFIKSLLGNTKNLMVVGAPAQSIYEWRGANFSTLNEKFHKDFPSAETVTLSTSYRSGSAIIEAAASVVPKSPEVWLSSDIQNSKVIVMDNSNDVIEADRIAQEIQALHVDYGQEYRSMAALFRAWKQSPELEKAFVNHGIPYVLYGESPPFYENREIRQMLAYLRLILALSDPDGEQLDLDGALDLIINTPPRGIGPSSIKTIRGRKPQIGWAEFMAAMVSEKLRESVRDATKTLFELLNRLARKADVLTPAEMVQAVIRETGWDQWLDAELDGRKVMRNLKTLINEAHTYDLLQEFTQEVESKMRSEINENGVALSTIHASKGLEWPIVFVVGLNEGILPHILSLESNDDPQEEANLAHVAFSRSMSLLVLSWFKERQHVSTGRAITQKPSRYLGRVPKDYISPYLAKKLGESVFDITTSIEFAYENEEITASGFFG